MLKSRMSPSTEKSANFELLVLSQNASNHVIHTWSELGEFNSPFWIHWKCIWSLKYLKYLKYEFWNWWSLVTESADEVIQLVLIGRFSILNGSYWQRVDLLYKCWIKLIWHLLYSMYSVHCAHTPRICIEQCTLCIVCTLASKRSDWKSPSNASPRLS